MEGHTGTPDRAVIEQEDGSAIYIQPMEQGGRRYLDIRLWQTGPSGLVPTRTGLMVHMPDVGPMIDGMTELLNTSNGGEQVARVVCDITDGRRLRAEIEPFGTRFMARLGFWQRVRDSWKPIDEGIVIGADKVTAVQHAILRYRTWMAAAIRTHAEGGLPGLAPEALEAWPAPGADWLTVEPEHVALHPRGVRITWTLHTANGSHHVILEQWHRHESLWLPNRRTLPLTALDLDLLLSVCADRVDIPEGKQHAEKLVLRDGTDLRVTVTDSEAGAIFSAETNGDVIWAIPTSEIPRFATALAQSWFMLSAHLSAPERAAIQEEAAERKGPAHEEMAEIESRDEAQAPVQAADTPEPVEPEEPEQPRRERPWLPPDFALPLEPPTAAPVRTIPFGNRTDLPGKVTLLEREIQIGIEGFVRPRSISMPRLTLPAVLLGLERLRRQQFTQDHAALYEQADLGIYARLSRSLRPPMLELRVWQHTETEAVVVELSAMPELLSALRQCAGEAEPAAESTSEIPAYSPDAADMSSDRARRETGSLSVPINTTILGNNHVNLRLHGSKDRPWLVLDWEKGTIQVALDNLPEVLEHLRELYYDSLRGRRGRSILVGDNPSLTLGVRTYDHQLHCVLRQGEDGPALFFPASDVPELLNAARAAFAVL